MASHSLYIFAENTDLHDLEQEAVLKEQDLETLSYDELLNLAHQVELEHNVNAVFEELLKRASAGEPNQSEEGGRSTPTGTTYIIDGYIYLINASVTTSHVLTIVVNVISNIPSTAYFNFTLGYEYPAACHTNGTMQSIAGLSKGVHILTINTLGLVCGITIAADICAGSYNEHKHYTTLFGRPYSNSTSFHTVTSTDVTLHKITAFVLGVSTLFLNQLQLGETAEAVLTVVSGLNVAASFLNPVPALAVGQYYKITASYSYNYKCTTSVWIYASQSDYQSGVSPIYTATTVINIPH